MNTATKNVILTVSNRNTGAEVLRVSVPRESNWDDAVGFCRLGGWIDNTSYSWCGAFIAQVKSAH